MKAWIMFHSRRHSNNMIPIEILFNDSSILNHENIIWTHKDNQKGRVSQPKLCNNIQQSKNTLYILQNINLESSRSKFSPIITKRPRCCNINFVKVKYYTGRIQLQRMAGVHINRRRKLF